MAGREHKYVTRTVWTGNLGEGTSGYRSYSRIHELSGEGKQGVILASSDPAFRGDRTRYNPEELLVASLSSCHMLSYLHLCADRHICVLAYEDDPEGWMQMRPDGGGAFREVVLHPKVTVTPESDRELAASLHEEAHHLCFIANSVNFPVRFQPIILTSEP